MGTVNAPGRRGRPRATESTAAILEATLGLLSERGYAATSTADVAARARASKATIYRRWASKHALVADAIRHGLQGASTQSPGVSDPRDELVAVLEGIIKALAASPLGRAVRSVVSEAAHEPDLSAALKAVTTEAREKGPVRPLLIRCQDQGLLPEDADLDLLLDLILGAPYFQLLVRQVAPKPALARALVDQLFGAPRRDDRVDESPRARATI